VRLLLGVWRHIGRGCRLRWCARYLLLLLLLLPLFKLQQQLPCLGKKGGCLA
jgi:hypothetical protein